MDATELTRRLYVPNQDYWIRQFSKKYLSDRPLDFKKIEGGIISPTPDKEDQLGGGVFDRDLKFVCGSDNLYHDKRDGSFELKNVDKKCKWYYTTYKLYNSW